MHFARGKDSQCRTFFEDASSPSRLLQRDFHAGIQTWGYGPDTPATSSPHPRIWKTEMFQLWLSKSCAWSLVPPPAMS